MKKFRPVLGASAIALAVSAPAAWADVSAADVWAQLQDYAGRSGLTVTAGSEDAAGGTLTLTDVVFKADQPELAYTVTLDRLTLTENGDGTVALGMPASYPIVIDIRPPGEEPVQAEVTVTQTNLATLASGDPGAIAYEFTGDEITITLDRVNAADMGDATIALGAALTGLAGKYDFGAGDPQPVETSMTADAMTFHIDISAPSEGGALKANFEAHDITASSTGTLPAGVDYADMAAALNAGFAVSGGLAYGTAAYDFEFQDNGQTVSGNASAASGRLDFAMGSEGLSYNVAGAGLDLTFSGSDIPLPQVNVKLAESGFGLTMPLAKSDTPQDAALLLRLVGLEIDPSIWGMVDPAGQLPHDPMTLILDLKGKVNWLIDILAPDAEAGMAEMGTPAQIHALDIDELELTAAGASLTGTGAFTFDNDDLSTWGGMPAPDGAVDLTLTGANTLIDTLVTMGFLPQDQAMGAKMMMGMFAKPGAGPDTLTSRIEVTKDGHIFANGQQIQ